MILILNETTFEKALQDNPKLLVFFFREKGCSFCDKMKPIIHELGNEEKDYVLAEYALGTSPDSINAKYPIERFPTLYAFVDGKVVGKQEGSMPKEQVALTFTPEKLPPKQIPITNLSMLQLMTDEANLIDQIAPIRAHLAKVQKEIKMFADDGGAVVYIFGYKVIPNPYMSTTAAGNYPVYLAEWDKFMTIADREEMSIQRFDQTAPGFITLFAEKRVVSTIRDVFAGVRLVGPA